MPQVYHFGQEGLHNVLVIDLFGPNLEDLFDHCGRKFSVKTVCMAAKQMVGCTSPLGMLQRELTGIISNRSLECKPSTRRTSSTETSNQTTFSSDPRGPNRLARYCKSQLSRAEPIRHLTLFYRKRGLPVSSTSAWPNYGVTPRPSSTSRIVSASRLAGLRGT